MCESRNLLCRLKCNTLFEHVLGSALFDHASQALTLGLLKSKKILLIATFQGRFSKNHFIHYLS